MRYIELGNTSLSVSEIGIGTEHLGRCSQKVIDAVFKYAVELGFNYFDIVTGRDKQREKFGNTIKELREKIFITGHFYSRTREPVESKRLFESLLQQLQTDYVDVLFIQYVDKVADYDNIVNNGLYELAKQYQQEGKARYLGISGHKSDIGIKAVEDGLFDIIMHKVNLATGNISTPHKRGFAQGDGRDVFLQLCQKSNIGSIAMKPFWGGRLLQPNQPYTATPVQCLHYCLSQIGVQMVLAGVKSVEEVASLCAYYTASEQEKDFAPILSAQNIDERVVNDCVYCNHCLPCPQDIDIALMNQYLDEAMFNFTEELKKAYLHIVPNASDCIECGECIERCPFNIDAMEKMKTIIDMFSMKKSA